MTVRAAVLAGLLLAGLLLPGCHGAAQDHSRFENAALLSDRTVLFSFKHLVYRPAEGIAAFPDGGIPKYVEDEDLLATYHIPSGALRILRRERNRRWASGQGQYGIQRAKGTVALVTQGGQLRRDLAKTAYQDWLVDTADGSFRPVDFRDALPARGLRMTGMHLVDARGTLLFVTAPLSTPSGSRDERDAQLWIRTPRGDYVQVARTSHYERMDGDDLVYWLPQTRRYHAFDVVTHATRELPGYRVPPQEDPAEGVLVDTAGQHVQYGRKVGGSWAYEPLPIDPARLKEHQ